MRIIAGQRRGHKIEGPTSRHTRPTSDMVRESIFNILGDAPEGRVAIDLFAGTGALGLEALSRGAVHAIFVERDRAGAALIRRNLATLRYEDRGAVLATDVYRWARGFVPVEPEPMVVFIDPPYREYENHPARVRQLLQTLSERLSPGSILALESGKIPEAEILPNHESWDIRRYGSTRVAIRTLALEGGS